MSTWKQVEVRLAMLLVTVSGLALGGCAAPGTQGGRPRPLEGAGAPERFEPVGPALRVAPADTLTGGGCLNPLIDPRSGDRLVLVRSTTGHGDYEVREGRYGVGPAELIRVECNTGRPLGVVRR